MHLVHTRVPMNECTESTHTEYTYMSVWRGVMMYRLGALLLRRPPPPPTVSSAGVFRHCLGGGARLPLRVRVASGGRGRAKALHYARPPDRPVRPSPRPARPGIRPDADGQRDNHTACRTLPRAAPRRPPAPAAMCPTQSEPIRCCSPPALPTARGACRAQADGACERGPWDVAFFPAS